MNEHNTPDNNTENVIKGIRPETDVHIDAALVEIGMVTLYASIARHMYSPDLDTLRHTVSSLAKDTMEVANLIRDTADNMGISCHISPPQYADFGDSGGCVGVTIRISPQNQTLNLLLRASEAADSLD